MGIIDIVEDIQIPFDAKNKKKISTPPPTVNEIINVIQPTSATLKKEFEEAKLAFKHLRKTAGETNSY